MTHLPLKRIRTVALCGCGVLCCAALLGGCSGAKTHEIITQDQSCISCHSSGKETFEVDQPKGAISSGETILVKSSASSISVCKPVFADADGATVVPIKQWTASLDGGQAEVTLPEGTWIICAGEDDSAKSQVVCVSANNSESTTIQL